MMEGLKKRTRKAFGFRKKERDNDSTGSPDKEKSKKTNGAPNGFYGEIDWDRYTSPDVDDEGFSIRPGDQSEDILFNCAFATLDTRRTVVFVCAWLNGNWKKKSSLSLSLSLSLSHNSLYAVYVGVYTDPSNLLDQSTRALKAKAVSSSESEGEEDHLKKFKIRIKPLPSDSSSCSVPTMDELKASVGTLAISPSPLGQMRRNVSCEEIARPRRSTPTPTPGPEPDTPSKRSSENTNAFFGPPLEASFDTFEAQHLEVFTVEPDFWCQTRIQPPSPLARPFPSGAPPPLPPKNVPPTPPERPSSSVGSSGYYSVVPSVRADSSAYSDILLSEAQVASPIPDLDNVFGPPDTPKPVEDTFQSGWASFAGGSPTRPPPPDEPAPPPPFFSPPPDSPPRPVYASFPPPDSPSRPVYTSIPPPDSPPRPVYTSFPPPDSPPSLHASFPPPDSPPRPGYASFPPPDSPPRPGYASFPPPDSPLSPVRASIPPPDSPPPSPPCVSPAPDSAPSSPLGPPPEAPAPPLPAAFIQEESSPDFPPPLPQQQEEEEEEEDDDEVEEEVKELSMGFSSPCLLPPLPAERSPLAGAPLPLLLRRTPEPVLGFLREAGPVFIASPREFSPGLRGTPPPLPPLTYRSVVSSPAPGSRPSSPARPGTPQSGSPVPPLPPRPSSRPKLQPGKTSVGDLSRSFSPPVHSWSPPPFAPLARAESTSSISSVTSLSAASTPTLCLPVSTCSRGPSPLTMGPQDTLPVAAAFTETVSAYFKGADPSKCVVKISGEMVLSFPAGITRHFASHPSPPVLTFSITHYTRLEQVLPNPQLLCCDTTEPSADTKEFWVNMPNLMSHLRKVADQRPQATYYNVDMLKYQVAAEGIQSTPLNLAVSWRGDATSTDLRIDYKYNMEAMPVPVPLTNIHFMVPVDGGVAKLQAMLPPATWNPEQQEMLWKIPELSQKSENGGVGALLGRFALTKGPSKPSRLVVQFSSEGATLSGSNFQLAGTGYRLSLVKKRFCAGKYLADN
ncbi:SH3-containing GRB2-like protein 3-interacting protein 1 [Clupea harengus]|uniref:SH3-containing GRB2-like protein 3-interacting protein 1 n=1 Tax=Clupea harengus TaxID=7950 RepID=A0A8M1KAX8_CLUHA|nr:SH3-containing GRB2-like protein 3-interacting protein 1 [Clupea harengus]